MISRDNFDIAIIEGNLEIVEAYIAAHKGDANAINTSSLHHPPPLIAAAYYDRLSILNALLGAGANINVSAQTSKTALITAVEKGNDRIVQALLLNTCLDVDLRNSRNQTALMYAAYSGSFVIAQYLVDRGADVTLHSCKGFFYDVAEETAEQIAVRQGHLEIADFLKATRLKRGAPEIKGQAPSIAHSTSNEKDQKIEELTRELEGMKRLVADFTKSFAALVNLNENTSSSLSNTDAPPAYSSLSDTNEQKSFSQPKTTSQYATGLGIFGTGMQTGSALSSSSSLMGGAPPPSSLNRTK